MRILIQRVKEAQVTVNQSSVGKIGKGLLLFLGVHKNDTAAQADWLVKEIATLRLFPDAEGKMNLDIQQSQGDILVVSQFTLYGSCANGRRPDFTEAALPEFAIPLYQHFIKSLSQATGRQIQTGVFGAYMDVSLINDGPVTFLIEK